MSDNPYEILGLSPDATADEINEAYRKAARKAHPDAGGSTEEFTRVKNACVVLLDPKMREKFDRTGKISDSEPDNTQAKAMEIIANFFINSIDNADAPMGPRLSSVNIVDVAKMHFKQQQRAADQHIDAQKKKISKYRRALKRLKTKRKDDIINRMLNHHIFSVESIISQTEHEKGMMKLVLTILDDYSFGPDQDAIPDQRDTYRGGFFT